MPEIDQITRAHLASGLPSIIAATARGSDDGKTAIFTLEEIQTQNFFYLQTNLRKMTKKIVLIRRRRKKLEKDQKNNCRNHHINAKSLF